MLKYYTGIGSRETPEHILKEIEVISKKLSQQGYCLRSGGADGADSAFERGAQEKIIYLPWKGFNGRIKNSIWGYTEEHRLIAQSVWMDRYRSGNVAILWHQLKEPVQNLMTRNVCQVLGYSLVGIYYSEFVVCWTPDGETKGGTVQAIFIANRYEIPVYNLAIKSDRAQLKQMLDRDP